MQLKYGIFGLLLFLTGCSSEEDMKTHVPVAIPVLTVYPTVRDVPVFIDSIGVLKASVTLEVRPQVNGVVSEVFVKEGQLVKEGTPLLAIDSSPYGNKVLEVSAKLETDKATLRASQRKLERFQSLAEKELISQVEWDELVTAAEKASACVEADLAALNAAHMDLANCTMTSSIKGRLGRLDVHRGQLVSNGQALPLATVCNMDPLMVEFKITEKEALLLNEEALQIEVCSIHNHCDYFPAKVTFLDNHFDSKTGLLLVHAEIPNASSNLRPGQTVKIRIPIAVIAEAKLITQKAVKYNQDGPYIYLVDGDGNVEFRKVKLGSVQGNDIIIQEGLEPGEIVITDGHMRIYPGSKVDIKI